MLQNVIKLEKINLMKRQIDISFDKLWRCL